MATFTAVPSRNFYSLSHTLKMETVFSSELLVNTSISQATHHHVVEESNLHCHHLENLKHYIFAYIMINMLNRVCAVRTL
jgi:hypothetical protein